MRRREPAAPGAAIASPPPFLNPRVSEAQGPGGAARAPLPLLQADAVGVLGAIGAARPVGRPNFGRTVVVGWCRTLNERRATMRSTPSVETGQTCCFNTNFWEGRHLQATKAPLDPANRNPASRQPRPPVPYHWQLPGGAARRAAARGAARRQATVEPRHILFRREGGAARRRRPPAFAFALLEGGRCPHFRSHCRGMQRRRRRAWCLLGLCFAWWPCACNTHAHGHRWAHRVCFSCIIPRPAVSPPKKTQVRRCMHVGAEPGARAGGGHAGEALRGRAAVGGGGGN